MKKTQFTMFSVLLLVLCLTTPAFALSEKQFTGRDTDETVTITYRDVITNENGVDFYIAPVGAEITAHLHDNAVLYLAYGTFTDGYVYWQYDMTGTMVCHYDEGWEPPTLPAGDYTFTITQEMTDSFAAYYQTDAVPSVVLCAGRPNDGLGPAIRANLLFPEDAAREIAFSDVSPDMYYADAVTWGLGRSIINGTTFTTFSPDKTCSKAEILTFIWRVNGSPVAESSDTDTDSPLFPNLDGSEYYYHAVHWAYRHGMVDGGMDFDADAPCSRQLAMTYLWKALGSVASDTQTVYFTDIIHDIDCLNAVSWAVEHGITNGTSPTTFSPDKNCSRAEIITFLYRTYTDYHL